MDSEDLRTEALGLAGKLRRAGLHGEAQRLRAAAQNDRLEDSRRRRQIKTLETMVSAGHALMADAKGAA
jgi:hypothetical protein